MRIVLAIHHATRALVTYLACMDLINLSVQYRYATISQRYRVQRVKPLKDLEVKNMQPQDLL